MRDSIGSERRPFTPWLLRNAPKPDAEMRLFCLPYAGGSATIYHRWQTLLPASIDVCPIELPGRLSRLRESAFHELNSLVAALDHNLSTCFDRPFALFGYSMGGLIAFEWAREISRRRGREPAHLFVGACGAPDLERKRFSIEELSDMELAKKIIDLYGPRLEMVLGDYELRGLILGVMRNDLRMLDRYSFVRREPLRVPLTVLGGTRDESATRERLQQWTRHTSEACDVYAFPGDHFFIHTHERAVVELVKGVLEA
jgi:surfactin synthase thioesterase subunit